MTDLLTPLEPPPEDVARLCGTLRGDVAALDRAAEGVEVWGGVTIGWRRLGPARNFTSTILVHEGRGTVSRSWDIGAVVIPRRPKDEA